MLDNYSLSTILGAAHAMVNNTQSNVTVGPFCANTSISLRKHPTENSTQVVFTFNSEAFAVGSNVP